MRTSNLTATVFTRHRTPSRDNRQSLLFVAFFYLLGSTVYAVFAFPNFQAHSVILLQLLMAALPATLLVRATRNSADGDLTIKTGRHFITAGLAASGLVVMQIAALAAWSRSGYFVNFSLERLSAGGGYHRDSVFHVSFVQRILSTGRPSTGQHLDPIVPYHILSYYFDAAVLRLLQLDAWESYALLFFGKSTLILLSLLYFVVPLVEPRTRSLFWITSIVITLAYMSGWSAVGSHTQWVPVTTLLLVAPWLQRVLSDSHIPSSRLAALTVLVIWLTLGKASIGIAFGVLVGIWLVLTHGLTQRLASAGVLWVMFFLSWGLASGGGRLDPWAINVSRLLSRPIQSNAIISLILLVMVLAALHRRTPDVGFGRLTVVVGLALAAILTLAAPFRSGSDFSYFALGLFLVAMITVLPAIFVDQPKSIRTPSTLLLAALVAITPMTSASLLSPYGTRDVEQFTQDANLVSFEWFNIGLESPEHVSIVRSLRDPSIRSAQVRSRDRTEFHVLRDAIDAMLVQHGLTRGNTALFVPIEVFDQLEIDRYIAARGGRDDYTGLLLTAITGMPLVHGVLERTTSNYGFHAYLNSGEDVYRRDLLSMPLWYLCRFERPIIILHDLDARELSIECLG